MTLTTRRGKVESPMTIAANYNVEIRPSGPLGGYVAAPPSKNYTTRLILGAALAEGQSLIRRPAINDDALALVACCRAFGATIKEQNGDLIINGVVGQPRNPGRINPGNAGAVLRFLLGTACLMDGEVIFETDFAESLGQRPNEDLLAALRQLGAEAEGTGPEGCLPIRIAGGRSRVKSGPVRISGARSSQFLSSLLYLTPCLDATSEITVGEASSDQPGPLVSRPLIDQTMEALGQFHISLLANFEALKFTVYGGQCGLGSDRMVNADWPSAAALLCAVATAGGMATIHGLELDAQGERRTRDVLTKMGCEFSTPHPREMLIHSKGELRAVEFNGDLATDAVLAMVGAACVADGVSRFTGIGNLRLKECDRIREPLEELAKIGVDARCGEDWIEITGRPDGYEGGVSVDSRGDHRVAQMLAIVGMRCRKGLTITGAEHISKSYPDFFEDLQRLGVHLSLQPRATA